MNSAAFATIITRDHLAHARVLAERLRAFHEEPLYVLCIDDLAGHAEASGLPFQVVSLAEVLPPQHRGMTFFYTAFELCNALKPWLLRWILATTTHGRCIYLDADVFPFASLADGLEELELASVLLTPHALSPPPAPAAVLETTSLKYGVFNGGFVGVRACTEAMRFLDWQAARLTTLGFRGWRDVFVDQLWLNLAPVYFEGVKAWRHPGANVANWNLYERALSRAGDGYAVNGQPLVFAHMSNWRFDAPDDWTLGRPLAPGTDAALIAEIGRRYRDALAAAGYAESRRWPYGFGAFAGGRPITLPMRREWYERVMAGTAPAGSPFDHPEWFRGPRYVEWKRFVPLPVKRFIHKSITST